MEGSAVVYLWQATGRVDSESRYWSRVQYRRVSVTLDCQVLLDWARPIRPQALFGPDGPLAPSAPGQSTRFQLPDTSGVSRLKNRWFAKPQLVGALSSQRGQPAWMLAAMANSCSCPLA